MDPISLAVLGGSALFSWLGKKSADKGAKEATKIQQAAAERAAQYQQRAYDDASRFMRDQWAAGQAQMQPYSQMGHQALGTLGSMMGIAPQVGRSTPQTPSGGMPNQMPYPPMGSPPGSGMTLGAMGGGPPSMVRMRAPNGQVKPVPAQQVAHFEARGAVRV